MRLRSPRVTQEIATGINFKLNVSKIEGKITGRNGRKYNNAARDIFGWIDKKSAATF